jgi:predicted nuclease of predicted toxin-antitoxin system
MRFLVDECTGPAVAEWLRLQNHDVISVYDEIRGADDRDVIQKAYEQDRILITNDKDFGELVFREKKPHKGIILLRLEDERTANKISVLKHLLEKYEKYIPGSFIVVTETNVRITRNI